MTATNIFYNFVSFRYSPAVIWRCHNSNKAKLSRAGRIFKPYLSTADRHVEAILLKERKALFDVDDSVLHKLVNGSTYVSLPLESEPHTAASPALQQDPPSSENSSLQQVSTRSHEDLHSVHLSHLCFLKPPFSRLAS